MSIFKFLSFASLSLLFLGNIKARDCVDLTGNYLCPDGTKVEIYTEVDAQNAVYAYTIIYDRQGENSNNKYIIGKYTTYSGHTLEVSCDEAQFSTKITLFDNELIESTTSSFRLRNEGKILTTTETTVFKTVRPDKISDDCHKER